MEESILNSTKKILGIDPSYTAFDQDVITHINSAFSVLTQMGVGPTAGFFIEDEDMTWSDYDVPTEQLHLIKTYIYLKVRLGFDPPNTSFLIEAAQSQIEEYQWRISTFREYALGQEA